MTNILFQTDFFLYVSLRLLQRAKVAALQADLMGLYFGKPLYGSEWRETDNVLNLPELCHELHICCLSV